VFDLTAQVKRNNIVKYRDAFGRTTNFKRKNYKETFIVILCFKNVHIKRIGC
jgi:hypothetical protein